MRGLIHVETVELDADIGYRLSLPKEIVHTVTFGFTAQEIEPLTAYVRDEG